MCIVHEQVRAPNTRQLWCVLPLAVALSTLLAAAEKVDYLRDVKPLLTHKCTACHGVLKQEAGLRLDAGQLIRQGSDGGDVVRAGEPNASLLIERVSAQDPAERMPPEGEGEPLEPRQVAILATWIRDGAPFPEDETYASDPTEHWAFQIPKRPEVPRMDDRRWAHPVDAFVEEQRRRQGLVAVERADDATLLRRACFDLIGLPPSRAEQREFRLDNRPERWPELVDSLLQSPHYGERWGRHWMDIWRYSDWDGFKNQLRGSQRHIWRWRDWIIESLNEDKGYDQMILEMLAGDELTPDDAEVLRATGFLSRNYHHSNRNIWLDAAVEHTSKAWLGLTLNCARCHDHKYDPIPQQDYYRFRAIFEPHRIRTDLIPGENDPLKDGLPRAYDAELDAETYLFIAGNDKQPDKDHPLPPNVPELFDRELDPEAVELPLAAYYPALAESVVEQQLAAAQQQVKQAESAFAEAIAREQNVKDRDGETRDDDICSTPDSAQRETLQQQLDVARLKLRSLQARVAADRARYASSEASRDNSTSETTTGQSETKQLAAAAARAERRFNAKRAKIAVAEKRDALQAAEARTDVKDKESHAAAVSKLKKDLAAAEKQLQTARADLNKKDAKYTPLGKEFPRISSGRRLALARWIANRQNPLTARVAVNHIWLRHFGQPLVANVFDFGLRSPRPANAELLDWLAIELMENDWSMKHLHRLIVTSETWRLASTSANSQFAVQNESIDPENRFFWRANVRRLDAEIVRDSILAVGGQLDRTLGGPDIDYQKGETTQRRSVYIQHAYEKQMTMLVVFDVASPNECYRRSESIVPQQALALSNSSLSLSQSRRLAGQLSSEVDEECRAHNGANVDGANVDGAKDDGAIGNAVDRDKVDADRVFLEKAFLQVLSRRPSPAEVETCLAFLVRQSEILADTSRLTTFAGGQAPVVAPSADAQQRARENLVHVLLNHNDFVALR